MPLVPRLAARKKELMVLSATKGRSRLLGSRRQRGSKLAAAASVDVGPRIYRPLSRLWTMARACRDSSASLAVGTTLKVRHSPHLINIWQSTTKRSAVDDRDQPANTTVPHAPQTRSSLSFPIGNSKGWRALRSIIDAAGWGMPTLRSLVCVRIAAESLRQERPILQIEKPWARLQVPVTGQRST